MREGKLLYHDFNLEPVGEDFEEDLIRFLVTYYQTHPEPYELLIPQDVDLELLTEISTLVLTLMPLQLEILLNY